MKTRLVLSSYLHLLAWGLAFFLSLGTFMNMMPFAHSLLRAVINTLALASLFYGFGMLVYRYYEQERYVLLTLSAIVIFVLMTSLRFYINLGFSYKLGVLSYQPTNLAILVGVLFTNALALAISFLYQIIGLQQDSKAREIQLFQEQREAKLQFLRSQMNPHFLFNTLNNIYSLAVVKSDKTAPLVMRLSALLQYVVYDSQDDRIALTKELNHLKEYVELFKLQHEEELNIQLEQEGIVTDLLIEPLLLLPIVENCFKHCDFAENEAAYVHFKVIRTEEKLHFKLENSYNPQNQQKDRVGGVGLENIQKRLALKYPATTYQLTIAQKENSFYLELVFDIAVLVSKIN